MKNPYELAESILQTASDNGEQQKDSQNFASLDLYGASVRAKDQQDSETCQCFQLENESGTGQITLYQAFPGIDLVYNDMHMAYCNKNQEPATDVIEINYCREGRSECLFGQREYCYISAGDLSVCSLLDSAHESEFPTAHYHGITITVNLSVITEEMKRVLELLSVNLERIRELSRIREFTVIRANETIEHIFSELYKVPEEIRYGYIRVKVLELLLVLTGYDPAEDHSEHPYFPETQIRAVKEIHGFLRAHYREHYTIEELADRFMMSPTVLKKCFKGVYGDSIYSYMKRYRLQIAERLLSEDHLTVGEIASEIGYLNPNKFTTAFNREYGMPPTAYRKKKLQERPNG